MKKEVLFKIKELLNQSRMEFEELGAGVAVNHNLTDDEIRELVELEYGQTQQNVLELFTVMCKKLVKLAGEK